MRYKIKKGEIIAFVIIVIVISLNGFITLKSVKLELSEYTNQCMCCEGFDISKDYGEPNSYCTDTYYDEELNKCVLTMCKNGGFLFNQSDCYYDPINTTSCQLTAI